MLWWALIHTQTRPEIYTASFEVMNSPFFRAIDSEYCPNSGKLSTLHVCPPSKVATWNETQESTQIRGGIMPCGTEFRGMQFPWIGSLTHSKCCSSKAPVNHNMLQVKFPDLFFKVCENCEKLCAPKMCFLPGAINEGGSTPSSLW